MKLDLHVHIRRNQSLAELREVLRTRQLDGLAVTNFHNVSYAYFIRERLPEFLIIIGQEVESSAGHILAVGIADLIPDRLSPQETITRIHGQGGLAILPHPYLLRNSIFYQRYRPVLAFDAVETFNWRCGPLLWPNPVARFVFKNSHLPRVATTDSKESHTIGKCYIEVRAHTETEILAAIGAGHFTRHQETAYPNWAWLQDFTSKLVLPHRHYQCFLCGTALTLHWYPRRFTCMKCRHTELRFVSCPRRHFICAECRTHIDYTPEEFARYRARRGLEV